MYPLFSQFEQHVNGVGYKKVEHEVIMNIGWIVLFHIRSEDLSGLFPETVLTFYLERVAEEISFCIDLTADLLVEFPKETVWGQLNLRKETIRGQKQETYPAQKYGP